MTDNSLTNSEITWVRNVALETVAQQAGRRATSRIAEDIAYSHGANRSISPLLHRLKVTLKKPISPFLGLLSVFSATLHCARILSTVIFSFFITSIVCSYLVAPAMINSEIHPLIPQLNATEMVDSIPRVTYYEKFPENFDTIFGFKYKPAFTLIIKYLPFLSLFISAFVIANSHLRHVAISAAELSMTPMIPLGILSAASLTLVCVLQQVTPDVIFSSDSAKSTGILIFLSLFIPVFCYYVFLFLECILIGALSAVLSRSPIIMFSALASGFPRFGFGIIQPTWDTISKDGFRKFARNLWKQEVIKFGDEKGVLYVVKSLLLFFAGMILLTIGYAVIVLIGLLISFIGRVSIDYPNTPEIWDGIFVILLCIGVFNSVFALVVSDRKIQNSIMWFTFFGIVPPIVYNAITNSGAFFSNIGRSIELSSENFFELVGSVISRITMDFPLSFSFFDGILTLLFLISISTLLLRHFKIVGTSYEQIASVFLKTFFFVYGLAIIFSLAWSFLEVFPSLILDQIMELYNTSNWGIVELSVAIILIWIIIIAILPFFTLTRTTLRYVGAAINKPVPSDEFIGNFVAAPGYEKIQKLGQVAHDIRNGKNVAEWLYILAKLEGSASKTEPVCSRYYMILEEAQDAARLQSQIK